MADPYFEEKWPFGGKGSLDDVMAPVGEGPVEVNKILARADVYAGEYSFGGQANTLPSQPGLFVDSLGLIPTPLRTEIVTPLIALCEKSPFGHNMDTKMDEAVRKSWQLEPDLVQFKNPLWKAGIEKLSKVVADRLGYRGIPLECVLYKLLVYSEGGHFVKHQDTEKKDGMIATLVVQPPSDHEGGDLVVYRDGEEKYRHDFGKNDGTSAFLPHYAVHYADAEHALENVEKGYRLALVYSVCLPSTMRHLEKHQDQRLSEDLATGISKMGADNDSFALLLEHEYTVNSIRNLGSGALKGVDNARFYALEGANALVSNDNKLKFFIVQLQHEVRTYEDGYDSTLEGHYDISTWYTTTGDLLGKVEKVDNKDDKGDKDCKSIVKFNFLNPNQETFSELWDKYEKRIKHGGFTGNEGSTAITAYTRCAIVAWQKARHWENAIKFMPVGAAAVALNDCEMVAASSLRQLLRAVVTVLKAEDSEQYSSEHKELPMKFIKIFCELLVKAGDPDTVVLFFKEHCQAISGRKGNEVLIPSVTEIVRTFDWSAIGEVVSALIRSEKEEDEEGLSSMEFILRIIDGLEEGTAKQSLLELTVEKALKMDGKELLVMKGVGLLWKWVIHSGNKTFLESLIKILVNADTSVTGPSIRYLSEYLSGSSVVNELVPKRIKFLEDQIEALDTKFSWEMPNAEFSDNEQIQEFLRGPEESMMTNGVLNFSRYWEAQGYADEQEQKHCSFKMNATEDDHKVFLRIIKTTDWFLARQTELVEYQTELQFLKNRFGPGHSDKKRARLG
ncbi:hypothetical protein DVH05_022383 [Phytophthora capsici]|nr:hypothetical protein DVH05_022383 [Phytophthora capsici]